ncbi:MAG: DUF2169 domain-containing protein [Polyangiaceae bacterium]|nr:DUF2169 domain-containing protein [Polyangiaceae bacterium]
MDARGELPYSTLLWQPRPATWLVTIVCKATFSLEPGEAKLAAAQEPLFEHDAYWDDDAKRSLSAASDLSPTKPKVDVVLVGHAFAPPGKAVRSLVARLVVESIDKSIELVADRSVGPDGTVYQGPRFSRMPIVYERAAGGQGTWNPVGIDTKSRDKFGRAPLPNLTQVGRGDDTMSAGDPIGFGPVAPSWPARESKLGYHRATITSGSWRTEPLPEGFDLGFFNVAPADQQLDAISDSAGVLLENLHPRHAVLSTKLPGVRPRFTVTRRSGSTDRPAMRADTLVIDSDRSIATLTWRGHFAVEHQGESYRVAQSIERARQSWRTVEHAVGPRETMLDALASERTSAGEELVRDVDGTPFDRRTGATADPRATGGGVGLPFQNARARDAAKSTNPGLPFGEATATNATVGLPPTPPGLPPLPPPGQTSTIQGGLPFAGEAPASWSGAYPTAASLGVRPPTFGNPAPAMPAPPPSAPNQPPTVPPPPPPQPLVAPMAPPVAQAPVVTQALAPPSSAPAAAWSGVSGAPVAPPAPVLMHASTAALGGLVSASNAAADGRPTGANAGARHARSRATSCSCSGGAPRSLRESVARPSGRRSSTSSSRGRSTPRSTSPRSSTSPARWKTGVRSTRSSREGRRAAKTASTSRSSTPCAPTAASRRSCSCWSVRCASISTSSSCSRRPSLQRRRSPPATTSSRRPSSRPPRSWRPRGSSRRRTSRPR